MSIQYRLVEVWTSEEVRWRGGPAWDEAISRIRALRIAARASVWRGVGGCYENGELASQRVEAISFNMPVKLEIVVPAAELDAALGIVDAVITEGVVAVRDLGVISHKTRARLIPRQLRVKDAMTPSPTAVHEDTPVGEIVRLLLNASFNGVPVVDTWGHPVGIVTQGDLIRRGGLPVRLGLLAEFGGEQVEAYLARIAGKTAREVMTAPVTTVGQDRLLGEAVDSMLQRRLKRLPVVDSEGALVGMLSRFDIFRTISAEAPDWDAIRSQCESIDVAHAALVSDVMRRDTRAVSPDTPLDEVIRLIGAADIQRVAVVDGEGDLVGLVSDRDLLAAFSEHRAGVWDYLVSRLSPAEFSHRHGELLARARSAKAGDVMLTDVVSVREDAPIDEAIRLMTERGIKRLPVVDAGGKYTGMVSRDSVLRAGFHH